ncbi:MAG: DUF3052 domain-containing protein [Rhizobiales bacterium]|nr:DUF3052 domain-containing protein [Hyphomicrobiales bacterium]
MNTGYSGTPLLKKLGVKPDQTALLIGVPGEVAELAHYDAFAGRTCIASLAQPALTAACAEGPFNYVHVFEKDARALEASIDRLREALVPNGMIWASWPKKASKVATTLTEDVIRDLALAHGLVDVKVCAVDAVWSGLKLVIPVADRPQ